MKLRSCLSLLLAVILCLSGAAALAEETAEPILYAMGDTMQDFTFTACDGKSYTLSETLKSKDMVFIDLWATWCGPCRKEFPFMEEVYQEYKDRIEIFALSCEATDTDEMLAGYAAEMGVTFPVGRDTAGLADAFMVTTIPTAVVVDRFGRVCFLEPGSQTAADNFRRLFNEFVGEAYTESKILDAVPPATPNIAPADSQALAVLNAEGGNLVFTNPDDPYNWPMALTAEGERTCAMTTNAGIADSVSAVQTVISAQAGDALAFDYKISTEAGLDFLTVSFNGETIRVASGEKDWTTAVIPFPGEGEYTVSLGYEKNAVTDGGEDAVWLARVKRLTDGEAAAAIAALPAYPVGGEVSLKLIAEDAREIQIDDPARTLAGTFGQDAVYYIVPSDTVEFQATLTADYNPVSALLKTSRGETYVLADILEEGAYRISASVGGFYNTAALYPDARANAALYVVYFNGEESVNSFLERNYTDANGTVTASWHYKTDASGADLPLALSVGYTLHFVDQNGDPVAGVLANVCDDATCELMTSDAEGKIAFTKAPFSYHIQVLRVPEGYSYDSSAESYLTVDGGETTYLVTKE